MNAPDHTSRGDVPTRWAELVVALLIVVGGLVVIQDSLRVGIAWESDGPKAGYFPFFIGIILCGAGLVIAAQTLMKWKAMAGKTFVTRGELKPVLQMLVPSAVYVSALPFVGIYVASAIFIAGFMVWQGKYRWWVSALVGIGVSLFVFMLFERWFLVPLPKGPLEAWLGY